MLLIADSCRVSFPLFSQISDLFAAEVDSKYVAYYTAWSIAGSKASQKFSDYRKETLGSLFFIALEIFVGIKGSVHLESIRTAMTGMTIEKVKELDVASIKELTLEIDSSGAAVYEGCSVRLFIALDAV